VNGKFFKGNFGGHHWEEWLVYTKEEPELESVVTVVKSDGSEKDVVVTETEARTKVVGQPPRQKTITYGWGSRWVEAL
jgi:hypothetical protein